MPEPVLTPQPYAPHGGPDGRLDRCEVKLDFSVNSNPFGPPKGLLEHLNTLNLSPYPDPAYPAAHAAVANYHGVAPGDIVLDKVVLGGAAELTYRLSACYLKPGRSVLVAAPGFGEYSRAAGLYGAQVYNLSVYSRGAEPDADRLVRAVQETRPTLVWLAQPNNPTGHAWSTGSLERVAEVCREHDALLVIDAAYLELSRAAPDLPNSALVLVPLTKTFAIAGLRAGYALAPPEVAETLRRAAPPWSVSTPAAAAVVWCRSDDGQAFVRETVPELLELREAFQGGLRKLEFRVWDTCSSFFLVEVGDAPAFTAQARDAGFRVRDASSFGLPTCVRLAAGLRGDNETFLRWLASC